MNTCPPLALTLPQGSTARWNIRLKRDRPKQRKKMDYSAQKQRVFTVIN